MLTRQAYLLFYKRCKSEGQTEEEDSEDYDKEERENKEERVRHFARFRAHMKERPSVKISEENFLYEHAIVSDCVLLAIMFRFLYFLATAAARFFLS